MKSKPINNNVLVEITREYAGVSRPDGLDEPHNTGILLDFSINRYHLTASAALMFDEAFISQLTTTLEGLRGKTVRWEELAEAGQTFNEDGKEYAVIPWWRLISAEEA